MSQQRAAAPEPEEIAGRYQVIKRLGAGAFGTVYKVKDKVLGRMLAIKTIRLEGLAASGISIDELMDRFRREAQISAQLKHPNIVTIYDVGEADGMSYLAMEFIDGVGLDRVIATAGRLPLERAALIGAQVADALDFAHRHNVVHRDVKPANIMIEAGDRVKVTDFGIAKVTDSGDHLTMTGSLLGTPSYMSPEQAKGGKLDGRSDLFAVGAIVYEMLVGQKAFRGDSITGLIFKIITEEPQLITELDPSIPLDMAGIVQRAMAKAPENRYQSGRELAEDLLAFSRSGSTPTLRQAEIDTMRGASAPAAPTFSGQSATVSGPTQGRPPATEIARPASAPAEPTVLSASGPARPPAVDPTYLVGSGARPAPPPPPMAAPPLPPPGAAARPPVAAGAPPVPPPARAGQEAAVPAPPVARGARPAPEKSKTGLVLGLVAAAAALVLLVGGGAAYFMMNRPDTPATTDSATGSTTATGGSGAATTTASPAPYAASPAASAGPDAAGTATTGSGQVATGGTTAATGGGTTGTATQGGSVPPATGGATTAAVSRPPANTGYGTTTPPADTRVPTRSAEADLSVLDQVPPELSGREAGASVADTYRSGRGNGGSFGASGRLRARSKVPPDLTLGEKRAAVVLVNLMGLQAVHQRRNGRYGTFQEVMPVAVGSPSRFDRAGYRFDLKLEDGGYTIMATSMSGRALIADDSGFVRYAED